MGQNEREGIDFLADSPLKPFLMPNTPLYALFNPHIHPIPHLQLLINNNFFKTMQSKLIVSKHAYADGHESFPPQIASSKSNKHIDYQLKDKEAQLIKSKLPIDFLLINL